MKKIGTLFILLLFTSSFCVAQSVDEIIELHLKAIGGEKAWNAIKTIEIKSIANNEGTLIESTKRIEKNKNYRTDLHYLSRMPNNNDKQDDARYYIIISEKGAWQYLPDNLNHSVSKIDDNLLDDYKQQMNFMDPFINYKQQNNLIKLMPLEYINEEEYYKFWIKYVNGKEEYFYINTKTNLIFKRILINAEVEDWSEVEAYQTLPNGMVFAKHIETAVGKTTIESVKINVVFDKETFKVPFSSVDNKYKFLK